MVRYEGGGGSYTPTAPRPANPVEDAAKKFISEANSPATQSQQQVYTIIQQGPPPGSVDQGTPYVEEPSEPVNDMGITPAEKAKIISSYKGHKAEFR